MRAWMVGIAVVVAIGLIWSVAVMANLVPVDGSEIVWPRYRGLLTNSPLADAPRLPSLGPCKRVARHGAMTPAGRVADSYRLWPRVSTPILIARLTLWDILELPPSRWFLQWDLEAPALPGLSFYSRRQLFANAVIAASRVAA
jgi:hypothetical protein